MNLLLPVEVRLSVNPNGSFALSVGGLDVPVTPAELADVMKSQTPPTLLPMALPAPKKLGRPPGRMCRYGDAKAMPGKGLCQKHLAVAVRSVAKARAAKKISRKTT